MGKGRSIGFVGIFQPTMIEALFGKRPLGLGEVLFRLGPAMDNAVLFGRLFLLRPRLGLAELAKIDDVPAHF